MDTVTEAWRDLLRAIRREWFCRPLRDMAQRVRDSGARLSRRISRTREPEQWVPLARLVEAEAKAAEWKTSARGLSAALAKAAATARPAREPFTNIDPERLEELAYQRGLKDAGAIKAWRESEKLRKAVNEVLSRYAWEDKDAPKEWGEMSEALPAVSDIAWRIARRQYDEW